MTYFRSLAINPMAIDLVETDEYGKRTIFGTVSGRTVTIDLGDGSGAVVVDMDTTPRNLFGDALVRALIGMPSAHEAEIRALRCVYLDVVKPTIKDAPIYIPTRTGSVELRDGGDGVIWVEYHNQAIGMREFKLADTMTLIDELYEDTSHRDDVNLGVELLLRIYKRLPVEYHQSPPPSVFG